MANSKCSKCDGHSFEMKTVNPVGSNEKVNFIQCAACGAVVGVLDFFSLSTVFDSQNQAIKMIADKLGVKVDL